MEKRWIVLPKGDGLTTQNLSKALSIDTPLASLLVQRGVTNFEEAKNYFRPNLKQLHDPFLMKDMDKAVQRIERAISKKEKILIYGDYDVDGTTAVALVYSFLLEYYDQLDYYIPDRYDEGYGISYKGIDYAESEQFSLIIALDCGIKAIEKIKYANDKGIDFIICDHHRPGKEIPDAVAVLDPKQENCNYPYDELSGCGIGFKLVQAFAGSRNIPFDKLTPLLDLTAISIACDIVPITNENRILVHHGLKQLNTNPRKGIAGILEIAKKTQTVTVNDLVFVIGPRINAAGRLEHGKKAVELLTSTNEDEALQAGIDISDTNTSRREIDKSITEEALGIIRQNPDLINAKTTVLYNENWHKGVVGIVASRLIETYYRPTIILTKSNGKVTGSARSVKGFDVYNAIDACKDLLDQFGGHKYAAGLTMSVENILGFQKKFEEVVAATITPEQLIPEIVADAEIDLDIITPKFYRILQQFAPFGPQNMKPTFITRGIVDNGFTKAVGVGEDHLKLDVVQNKNPNIRFSGIGFNLGFLAEEISLGHPFDIIYTIEENEWNGNVSLQLNVKDIHLTQ